MAAAVIDSQLELLDLRHFSAAQLRPLLRDESARWLRRLHWDYTQAADVLLNYLDSRILPGYVAVHGRAGSRGENIAGFAFCVYEASKAVIGDVYAFHETEADHNPVCDLLLDRLIEMLQATPGVDRIESQLLMFPAGALATPFLTRGFHSHPRLFMLCNLTARNETLVEQQRHLDRSATASSSLAAQSSPHVSLPAPLTFSSWRPEFYNLAADLIHRAYRDHADSLINDQYRTLPGAQRFLHNIIHFPGCGTFDVRNSLVLHEGNHIAAVILCSRVHPRVGHITQLCVAPHLRHTGLASALLQRCTAQLLAQGVTEITLTVTESNTSALRIYQRHGFQTLHRFDAMVWDANSRQ